MPTPAETIAYQAGYEAGRQAGRAEAARAAAEGAARRCDHEGCGSAGTVARWPGRYCVWHAEEEQALSERLEQHFCAFEDCDQAPERDGFCYGHAHDALAELERDHHALEHCRCELALAWRAASGSR
jgi:hypothetical protein